MHSQIVGMVFDLIYGIWTSHCENGIIKTGQPLHPLVFPNYQATPLSDYSVRLLLLVAVRYKTNNQKVLSTIFHLHIFHGTVIFVT